MLCERAAVHCNVTNTHNSLRHKVVIATVSPYRPHIWFSVISELTVRMLSPVQSTISKPWGWFWKKKKYYLAFGNVCGVKMTLAVSNYCRFYFFYFFFSCFAVNFYKEPTSNNLQWKKKKLFWLTINKNIFGNTLFES